MASGAIHVSNVNILLQGWSWELWCLRSLRELCGKPLGALQLMTMAMTGYWHVDAAYYCAVLSISSDSMTS